MVAKEPEQPPTQPGDWEDRDREFLFIPGSDPPQVKGGVFPWQRRIGHQPGHPCGHCGGAWRYGLAAVQEAGAIFRCLHCGGLIRIR